MASELVTNVVEHTACEPVVTVSSMDGNLRIEVSDDDPGEPVVQPLDPSRVGGNGLRIVDRWADTWGVDHRPNHGKVVWFAVAKTAPHPPVARSTLS